MDPDKLNLSLSRYLSLARYLSRYLSRDILYVQNGDRSGSIYKILVF